MREIDEVLVEVGEVLGEGWPRVGGAEVAALVDALGDDHLDRWLAVESLYNDAIDEVGTEHLRVGFKIGVAAGAAWAASEDQRVVAAVVRSLAPVIAERGPVNGKLADAVRVAVDALRVLGGESE